MKTRVTINERIKDLRKNRNLTIEKLAEEIGMSSSTYGNYELDDYPVPHPVIILLAEYYSVSTDYLLGLTDSLSTDNTIVSELHLSDAAIDMIKAPQINSRLLSEIIESDAFRQLLTDAEIYVDGYVDQSIGQYNAIMDMLRKRISDKNCSEKDTAIQALEHIRVAQQDYFGRLFAKELITILDELKDRHSKDRETSDGTYSPEQLEQIFQTMNDNRSNPVKGLATVIRNALQLRNTEKNMQISEKLFETEMPDEEAIEAVLSPSPIIEPDARKRRKR